MSEITISTLNSDPEIRNNLLKEVDFLHREGINVQLTEVNSGKYIFLNYAIQENQPDLKEAHEKILRYYLANILTDLLMNTITRESMMRIVKARYHFIAPGEMKTIVKNAYNFLNNLYEDGDISQALYRHNQILTSVNQYLETDSELFLEGFLRFRLKEYCLEMEQSVEKAIDSFLVEREYVEFIKLLQYFVEIQEPRIDEVHVFIRDSQNFYLLDEEKQPIEQQHLEDVLAELRSENTEVDYEDLLLSALITISPRRIVLHVLTKIEIVDTIISVFQERAILCQGCDLCGLRPVPVVSNRSRSPHVPK